MNILLTGGAGYIGSHVAVVLSQAGHNVVLLDNFINSRRFVLDQLQEILGRELPCIVCDVRNTLEVTKALQDYSIEGVVHLAGLKAVGESVDNPIDYFNTNVGGTLSLLHSMRLCGIKFLVFCSSATVYGDPKYLPLDESHPVQTTNPYGRSKLHIEEILADVATSDPAWRITCLRYFNPVGAHDSGLIGEFPNGIPSNLVPYIAQVASGKLPYLNVYGSDYDTCVGTGVRDYIHVMDLAEGHLAAFDFLRERAGLHIFNLGTGKGSSVIEIVKTFEDVCGKFIPLKYTDKRSGDVASCYSRVEKARLHLNWNANRNLRKMCASTWNFQKNLQCNNL